MRLQRWKAIIYQADSHCQVSSPGIFMSDFLFMFVAIAVQGLAVSHHKLLGICFFHVFVPVIIYPLEVSHSLLRFT